MNEIIDSDPVLIYRLGFLGDTVVALPIFYKLAQHFHGSRRILITNTPISSKTVPSDLLLANTGLVHELISYSQGIREISALTELHAAIRNTKARTLVYISDTKSVIKTFRDLAFFATCGIRRFIGAPATLARAYCKIDPATGELERETSRLARCLSKLGPINLNNGANWDLKLTPNEHEVARRLLAPLAQAPFLTVCVGGKSPTKKWGTDNWRYVLNDLSSTFSDLALVLVGSSDEYELCEHIGINWKNRKINTCGRLHARETAALLRRSLLFVGHDCGPMHLAASQGVKCICVFGSNNRPRQWHPYGQGHTIFHDVRGVGHISPAAVVEAAKAELYTTF